MCVCICVCVCVSVNEPQCTWGLNWANFRIFCGRLKTLWLVWTLRRGYFTVSGLVLGSGLGANVKVTYSRMQGKCVCWCMHVKYLQNTVMKMNKVKERINTVQETTYPDNSLSTIQ